ncbi:hypothetical protein DFH28DRAFT_854473, partial [Melampsora americana]
MAWTIYYRKFIQTIQHRFKFFKLAEWLEKHKENIELMRKTEITLADGLIGPIGTSEKREDLKELFFAKAGKCDELTFSDNPYTIGGGCFDWNHKTGAPKKQALSRNSLYQKN